MKIIFSVLEKDKKKEVEQDLQVVRLSISPKKGHEKLEEDCNNQEVEIKQLKKESEEQENNLSLINDKLMAMVKELQKKNTDQDKELTEFKEHNTKLIEALDNTTNDVTTLEQQQEDLKHGLKVMDESDKAKSS